MPQQRDSATILSRSGIRKPFRGGLIRSVDAFDAATTIPDDRTVSIRDRNGRAV